MKKNLLLISLILIAFAINAQITITQSDIISIGQSKMNGVDTLPSRVNAILPGAPGANQTWSFTTPVTLWYDTMQALAPSGLPSASAYPNANLAIKTRTNNYPAYFYGKKDASALYIYGIVADVASSGSLTNVPFTPGFSMIQFPATYNSNFTENYTSFLRMVAPPNQLNADSIKRNAYTNRVSLIDAWGSITTPAGTFASTIRQKVTEITTDTMWARIPFVGWYQISANVDTAVTYSWWAYGIGLPVFEIDFDMATQLTTQVKWYIDPSVDVNANTANGNINVFPNPASEIINLSNLNPEKVYTVSVKNILGQEMQNILIDNKNNCTIETSAFANGIYFVNILENGITTRTEKILISK